MPAGDAFFPSQLSQLFLGIALQLFTCHAAQLRRPATTGPGLKDSSPGVLAGCTLAGCCGRSRTSISVEGGCRRAPGGFAVPRHGEQRVKGLESLSLNQFALQRQKKTNPPVVERIALRVCS